jgi:hypothetical protein
MSTHNFIPEDIKNMTLDQIIENSYEVKKRGNTLTVKMAVEHTTLITLSLWVSDVIIPKKNIADKPSKHKKIKELRDEGLTQQEISNLLGISQPYVSLALKEINKE